MLNLGRYSYTRVSIIVLVALAILISVLRMHYYDWPPNRDVTEYAVTSHELLKGKKLYSEVWNPKPPAIFLSYSAAEMAFGYGESAIFFMNLVCALITLCGVYAAGPVSGNGRIAGVWSALFWAALSGDISLQFHDANTEAFMNACIIWAFVLFFVQSDRPFGYGRAVAIGALFAWASLYKHVIVVIPIALSVAHIVLHPAETSRRQAVTHVFIIAAIGVLSWVVLVSYMAMTGRFQIFYDTMITHAFAYAVRPSANVIGAASTVNLIEGVRRFQVIIPLLFLASTGIYFGLIKERLRNWALIVMYGIGAFISIALPGKFYRHYFQLGIPPLVVAAGWATASLSRNAPKLRASIPHIVAAAILLFVIWNQIPYYRSQPEIQLKGTYAERYLVTQQLGRKLASMLKPDESIFQWGAESGLYFFSRRRPPGEILGWSLYGSTFGKQFTEKTLHAFGKSAPDFIVIAKDFVEIQPDHPMTNWIKENYRPVAGLTEQEDKYFVLMARCGSSTESRILILNN